MSVFFILLSIICLSSCDEECKRNFSIRKNAIILTKSSQAKGANFIHKQVVSKFPECYALCCSNPDCTVAVYENKVNHICFLFNCKQPNVCSFTEHSHYISMMYMKPESKPNKYDKPKLDLTRPSADGKLGELCGTLRKCGPENSMCTSGTCICQLGFIARNGECVRSICPKPELMFQCNDVSKMPFCIALYDQCNGLLECGDGSDELNCEDKTMGKSILPNKTSNIQTRVKTERKIVNQASDTNSDLPLKLPKEQIDSDDHPLRENTNISHSSRYHKSMNKLPGSRRINPLVENQLLVLESKNSLPKYSHSNHQRSKPHRPYQKSQRESDSNSNQAYENRRYRKLKASSYPHLTKIDDYYQKNIPESSDSNSRWNNLDSYYTDYDYPQLNINNRDQSSDWYNTDKGSNSDSDSSYPDSNGKYTYSDFMDSDDDVYTKPKGRYINENDYYNSRGYSHKAFEPSMSHNKLRYKDQGKEHRIFIKPKQLQVSNPTTISSKDVAKINDDNMDNINTQEWSTAVIMLSLGLLITATLLIAIGIKMRAWRRKLRKGKKGKSLTTDEGDYLINGMYL